jgi:hypothetical protein
VPKFPLGRVIATKNVVRTLSQETVTSALLRHVSGDWGLVEEQDRILNERALTIAERLFSIYRSDEGVKFYVITEWDRSVTTILLPEDY